MLNRLVIFGRANAQANAKLNEKNAAIDQLK
jgi:hypothetical protein